MESPIENVDGGNPERNERHPARAGWRVEWIYDLLSVPDVPEEDEPVSVGGIFRLLCRPR